MGPRPSATSAAPSKFPDRVLMAVRRIPAGRVATYGDIAALVGRPRAARAVGRVMRECHAEGVPCHRVVAAGGRLGGYGGAPWVKRERLRGEGIAVAGDRIRRFEAVRWNGERPRPSRATGQPPDP
ncbi:MAG: MGMT family protein [Acidobacteria bacterium]|nr:MGMT family protein [Acidobacteriota bacterium]